MGRILKSAIALAVVGFAVYRGLRMIGIIGSDDAVDFEWADDAN